MSGGDSGMITTLGSRIIGGLTPQYLGLLLINVVFLGCVFWLLVEQNDSRERSLSPLLAACSRTVPMETFNVLMQHAFRDNPIPAVRLGQ